MSELEQICKIYGISEEKCNDIVDGFPPFARYDHDRVVSKAISVYGESNVDRIKSAVLKFPPFAGLDHSRVLSESSEVYGESNVEKIKGAVLKFPPFAGYDHTRVYRQKTRIGRLVGLTEQESVDYILGSPVNAGYSYKSDLARIDVVRKLEGEGLEITSKIKDWFMKNYMKSPYVSGRLRVSHVKDGEEPKLLTFARKKFL